MLYTEQESITLRKPAKGVQSGDLLLEFASRQRLRTYRPRQTVLHQSDRTDHVLVVLNGWAEQVLQLPDGRRQILSLALPGDLCSTNLNTRAGVDCSITALTPLTISIIGKFEFRTLLTGHSKLARCFWRNQLLSLAIQRRWTAVLGLMNAKARIAHLMCELYFRQEKSGLADGATCSFPLTQTQIAEVCGLTQVHTNRIIQELRRRDLIDLRSRRLKVKSLSELCAIAQFDPSYLDMTEPEVGGFAGPLPS